MDPKLKNGPSRGDLRQRRGLSMALPAVEASHVLEALKSMGWVQSVGMGIAPLSASEIYSWSRLTRTEVEPWEFQAMRAASSAYCAESASDNQIEPVTRQ